jgi:DNA-binding beta-propeller fold protein YncE
VPYKILETIKIGGEGGFDYVTADSDGRNLYVARSGPAGHIGVFSLDTFAQVGDIPGVSAHGAMVDPTSGHGFATSKPITMFDAKTFALIKKIEVQGTMKVTGRYDLSSKSGGCAGLAIDDKNNILFAACRDKNDMVILSATDGHIITDLPIGHGSDGAAFNPATMEAFSSEGDGTLTKRERKPLTLVMG